MRRAVFFDRDGVLIEDQGLLTRVEQISVLDGAGPALSGLKRAGFLLIVVTNQAVVARGLVSERQLEEIHAAMCQRLQEAGAPPLDAIYFCPHHPQADLPEYRVACECRKPRPGLLLRAAQEHAITLERSFLIGDRITDIAAGSKAGCRTALVRRPGWEPQPIVTLDLPDASWQADHTCPTLAAAVAWILEAP